MVRNKRLIVWVISAFISLLSILYLYTSLYNNLPDSIMVDKEQVVSVSENPGSVLNANIDKDLLNSRYVSSGENNSINLRLFNLITIKNIDVKFVERKRLIPSGEIAGIYVDTEGIMVIGTGSVNDSSGVRVEPGKDVVKSGDYIIAINGEKIQTKKQLVEKVNEFGHEKVTLTVRRNNELIEREITPVKIGNNEYKLGIWVRDNAVGIGTVTYYTPEGVFAALGHGIADIDTGLLMEIDEGKLFSTKILSLTKGERGTPGQITGIIDYGKENILGEITSNSESGIKGEVRGDVSIAGISEGIEIGYKQEINKGPAKIMCTIDDRVKEYDIEITDINYSNASKGIGIKVTDEELLTVTGGIIQGMSGAPIMQNGRIVGAVTHVLVNDPTRGYGIFIENMLEHN